MKRTLIASIIGMSSIALIAAANAQGNINLYNYNSSGPVPNPITYLPGGQPVVGDTVNHTSSWTVGMYVAVGDIASSVNASFGGNSFGAVFGMGAQATGTGATTLLGDYAAGQYSSGEEYHTGFAGGSTVTVVVVAYNGASYESSLIRGHSQAFTMATTSGAEFAPLTGSFMNGFAVVVPEPSTFALAGLGMASLLIFRRRN